MGFLGIGIGSISCTINKDVFYPGETLTGTVFLDMKEEVKARGVFVQLIATKKEGKQMRTIYDKTIALDTERTYRPTDSQKQYEFSFTIPKYILHDLRPGNKLLDSISNFFIQMANDAISWYVITKLDVPLSFDVSKKIKIKVRSAPINQKI